MGIAFILENQSKTNPAENMILLSKDMPGAGWSKEETANPRFFEHYANETSWYIISTANETTGFSATIVVFRSPEDSRTTLLKLLDENENHSAMNMNFINISIGDKAFLATDGFQYILVFYKTNVLAALSTHPVEGDLYGDHSWQYNEILTYATLQLEKINSYLGS